MRRFLAFLFLLAAALHMAGQEPAFSYRRLYESTLNPDKKEYYTLLNEGKYEAVYQRAIANLQQLEKRSNALLALAVYYHYMRSDSAYYFVELYFNSTVASEYEMYGNLAFDAVTDYFFAGSMATDTAMESVFLKIVTDFYKKKAYQDSDDGIKLMMLGYEDQKLRGYMQFVLDSVGSVQKATLEKDLADKDDRIQMTLLSMIKNHGYYTRASVGPVNFFQNLIFWHVGNLQRREQEVIPAIREAWGKGAYSTVAYINQLARTEELKGSINHRDGSYERFVEEKCRELKCENPDESTF